MALAGEDHDPAAGDACGSAPEQVFAVVRVGAATHHKGGCPHPAELGFGVEGDRGSVPSDTARMPATLRAMIVSVAPQPRNTMFSATLSPRSQSAHPY
jgi:hypothetical protein